MANVVDPNAWRTAPLPETRPSPIADPTVEHARSTSQQANASAAVLTLSTALERTFAEPGDRVVWNLTTAARLGSEVSEQLRRIDARHEALPPTGAATAADAAIEDEVARHPWLVLVENAREVALGNRSRRLRSAALGEGPLLIVVCENGETEPHQTIRNRATSRGEPASRIASRLRFDYVGPVEAAKESLEDALARVKQSGRSTVLYWDARTSAAPAPHFTTQARQELRPEREVHSLRSIATEALAELAQLDHPILAFSTDLDPWLPTAWELHGASLPGHERTSFALRHCASLALQGKRPFLFLSAEEFAAHRAIVCDEICGPDRGVTLVVECRQNQRASSLLFAGLSQFTELRLASPKDGAELRQMLTWCACQPHPTVIWLPEACEPEISSYEQTDVALGQAECLGTGTDVAIVAWGPSVATAALAAESLAQRGIEATTVNVRFAQPLDRQTLAQVCESAAFVVIIDDTPSGGGFAGWVTENLVRGRLKPNVAIVALTHPPDAHDPYEAHLRCAADIVERCHWLGEPIISPPIAMKAPAGANVQAAGAPPQMCIPSRDDSPAGGAIIHQQVLAQQFSPFIQQWVEDYARVGSRNVYLWRWCLRGLELTTLSSVAPELRQDLCDTKLLAVMYGVMLDDVADHAGSEEYLAALAGIIAGRPERDFSAFSAEQQEYARFTCDLWDTFQQRLQAAPRYQELAELLEHDHRQILNTFAYSCLVNKHPWLLNVQEHDMYMPHNMQMMSFATMDLMCSPSFDRNEAGRLREVVWHAQSMGRIGNLVSTWQREIADRDFTSGVFARALREGDLTPDDLEHAPGAVIESAIHRGRHEQFFLEKWETHRQAIVQLAAGIRSVKVSELLAALSRLLQMELQSVGWK